MASVTTKCVIKPLKKTISIISFQPKFSTFSLQYSNSKSNTSINVGISCRYGGGSSSRLQDSKQNNNSDAADDQALDVSSIRSNTVRLIDDQQNMVGIVSKISAIQMAEDAELDLVILSPDADPPVVKLMDYNKYRYEQQKKKKEQQKKNAALRMDQKELKMGYNIDVHDYSVRLRAAKKFLIDGDKLGIVESNNLRDKNMFMVLIPNKLAVQKESPKKKEKSTRKEVPASI
uniref:translation initiation factor IF3-4, chloroplastic-like isoform X2 n=1 Tax=Erigeron canadensis TaxID=72917 RepID=UPI001CB956A0|nr:translation initiation factor IF3-4, chloroplastic-like isoform X2 [Erigeron canadensis]